MGGVAETGVAPTPEVGFPPRGGTTGGAVGLGKGVGMVQN